MKAQKRDKYYTLTKCDQIVMPLQLAASTQSKDTHLNTCTIFESQKKSWTTLTTMEAAMLNMSTSIACVMTCPYSVVCNTAWLPCKQHLLLLHIKA